MNIVVAIELALLLALTMLYAVAVRRAQKVGAESDGLDYATAVSWAAWYQGGAIATGFCLIFTVIALGW